MYFTPAGLQQATHPVVADHRAARAGAARRGEAGAMLDLGCGVGSDLLAFARAGHRVEGVEVDPVTAAVASANLVALGLPGTVRVARAEEVDRQGYDVVFADPARRKGSTRVFDPRAFSPDWDFVLDLLASGGRIRGRVTQSVVKLAPGLDHALIPSHAEAEWVSLDGDLKEAVLWSPPPSPTAEGSAQVRRRATVLGSDGAHATCTDAEGRVDPAPVSPVGRYLYEPDDAVIRAHLVSTVARDVGGWLLDPHIAYTSSDQEVETPFARGFRVLETLPYREKALRSALRSRGIGSLTIKKRGVAVTPEGLRQRLALRGPERGTLVLTRTPGSAVALLVEPLERHGQPPAG
jgi:SAM-dependent methyltransferase